jgi:hypothetical protein
VRARIEDDILYIDKDDLPHFKKNGSVVRNNYFWAMKAIAAHAPFDRDWEYEAEVWLALQRILIAFAESGYLGLSETTLAFPPNGTEIPPVFRYVSTWQED